MQIQVRHHNLELTPKLLEHIHRRLGFALARFSSHVRNVIVRLEDLNGPKGGVAIECRIELRTAWNSRIRIEERDQDAFVAVARAVERAGRALQRQSNFTRMKTESRGVAIPFGD
jgi:putative sigma-54 modulation protein